MEDFLNVIGGCIKQNGKCQQALYEHYRGFAFKAVFRYIHAREEASEVVNDGFVKLLNNLHKFEVQKETDNDKLFMGWLKKIMINSAIDRLRRDKTNLKTEPVMDGDWILPEDVPDVTEILFYNDLIKIIKKLPPLYRMVFNLNVIDGYTHAEIAGILDIPVSTSRSYLLRARSLLQKSIIKMEDNKQCRM